jgi:hypothetical protein
MGDKSPKNSSAKKPAGKSIKEKRLDKKAKEDTSSQMDNLTHGTTPPPPPGGRGGPAPPPRPSRGREHAVEIGLQDRGQPPGVVDGHVVVVSVDE